MKTENNYQKLHKKFEDVYNRFYMKFEAVGMFKFHNLLWQLIINEVKKGEPVALSSNYEINGQELVFVRDGESGYSKTGVAFKPEVNYKEGAKIAEELNGFIFGYTKEQSENLIDQSFR